MVIIYAILKRLQWRWARHVYHMSGEHLPKRLLYGELNTGKFFNEAKISSINTILKVFLKSSGISSDTREKAVLIPCHLAQPDQPLGDCL